MDYKYVWIMINRDTGPEIVQADLKLWTNPEDKLSGRLCFNWIKVVHLDYDN